MDIYVKSNSNHPPGLPLMHFEELGEEWTGDAIRVGVGDGGRKVRKVVGWSDLYGGSPCDIRVVKVRTQEGDIGYLVHGGNSGVRVLGKEYAPIPGVDDHLPRGYGMPFLFIEERNLADIKSREVRAFVSHE